MPVFDSPRFTTIYAATEADECSLTPRSRLLVLSPLGNPARERESDRCDSGQDHREGSIVAIPTPSGSFPIPGDLVKILRSVRKAGSPPSVGAGSHLAPYWPFVTG